MLVLGLDTSTPRVSVGVVRAAERPRVTEPDRSPPPGHVLDAVLARVAVGDAQGGRQQHGEAVAPAVRQALREAQVDVGDLGAVAVGVGPGPFTGLRVGLMTAAALADALGVPAYGVPSLDAVAGGWSGDGALAVVTDARRREVYWAVYSPGPQRVEGPRVSSPAVLARALHDRGFADPDDGAVVVGPGAARYAEALEGFRLADPDATPDGAEVARLAVVRALQRAPSEPLTPLYLRRPDADEPGAAKKVTP